MKECNLKEMCRLMVIGFLALIVMGVLMSLYSCGSYKSTMKQETSTQKVDSIRQIRDFGFTSMQDISSFLHSTTSRKMNWRLYDTTKPINPDTGKHPLLAEGNTEENNEIKQDTNITAADSVMLKSDSSSSSQSQENVRQEQEKQKDETTLPKQISNMIWALITLVVISGVGWAIYKLKKRGNSCKITT